MEQLSTNKVILLVEDNLNDARLTIAGFRQNQMGNEIIHVKNGAEALDFLFCKNKYQKREREKEIQLVLMDLKLPKIDGLEVLSEIRNNEKTKKLPVVILSSSREECDVAQSYELGVNAYVCKPIDFNEFSRTIKTLGTFWLSLNELPSKNYIIQR